MSIQFDPFSRSIDLFRNLSSCLLSGSETYSSWQIDSMQAAITRGSQQLRTAWSDIGAAQEPEKWSDAMQSGLRNAIKMNRDYLIATTDYQMETMRLLQEMGAEIQQLVTEALNEQLVTIDVVGAREKRRNGALASQKLAA